MDNAILRTASIVGKLVLYFLYTILALTILVLGYLLFSGDTAAFSMISFTGSGFILFTEGTGEEAPPIGLLFFYGSKLCLLAVCYILIIRESLHIVDSIKSLDTFRLGNVKSFRKVGNLFVVLFLLTTVQVSSPAGSWELTLELAPAYLLGTLVGYLLAEVFREGNRLMEESKLTI